MSKPLRLISILGSLRATLVYALLGVATSLPAQAETLGEAVSRVLLKHPDVRSSQALLNAAEERVSQARSSYFPSVGVEAVAGEAKDRDANQGETDRSTRRADAYLRWNLFRGLADRQGVRAAESDSRAAAADLADAHESVALQVTSTYLEVWRLRQRVELMRMYMRDSGRLVNNVSKRVAGGKLAASEMEQARMSVIEVQWQLTQLQGQLAGAEERYRLITGQPAGELSPPGLVEPAAQVKLDVMMEQVLTENRRVTAALARAKARSEDVGIAAGELYPSLTLDVRRRFRSEIDPVPVTDTLKNTQLAINYEIPLGGGNFSRKREAVARMEAAQADADSVLLEVKTALGQAWSTWEEARHIEANLGERAHAGVKVVAAYDMQFDAGRRSVQDLISIRAEYFRALADVVENRHEQELGAAQVLNLLGKLRASLG